MSGATVEEVLDGGMRVVVTVATSSGEAWVVAGVPRSQQGTAKHAGDWTGYAAIEPYGDDLDGWCPHEGQDDPDAVLAEIVEDGAAMQAWLDIADEDEISVGTRVCGGDTDDDYDEGEVLKLVGDQATVAWDFSLEPTRQHVDTLRVL